MRKKFKKNDSKRRESRAYSLELMKLNYALERAEDLFSGTEMKFLDLTQ
jgi:hypothetical protein